MGSCYSCCCRRLTRRNNGGYELVDGYDSEKQPLLLSNNSPGVSFIVPKKASQFTVCFIGPSLCGKSCLLQRKVVGTFNSKYTPTIGVDFIKVSLPYKNDIITINCQDTAGDERFQVDDDKSLSLSCQAFVFLFDMSDSKSFQILEEKFIKTKAKHLFDRSSYWFLVGCKSDLVPRDLNKTQIDIFLRKYSKKNVEFIETSAKSGDGLTVLFEKLVSRLLNNR